MVPHPNERMLMLMREEELGRWEQRFLESPKQTMQQKRLTIRAFYASARAVATDKQGRILLSDPHCGWAGLDGEVVFLGSPGRIEIWSAKNYLANETASLAALSEAAEESGL